MASSAFGSSIRSQLAVTFIVVGAAAVALLLLLYFVPSTDVLVVTLVVISGIVAFSMFLAVRAVLRPIDRLAESTGMIASGGTLQRLELRLNNEIDPVAENINALMSRLREGERASGELQNAESRLGGLEQDYSELQLTYNNTVALGEIGQRITALLDLEQITATLYSSISSMMDASAFALGVFRAETLSMEFSTTIERDRRVVRYVIALADQGSLEAWSARHQQEIHLNDVERDHARYVATLTHADGTSLAKSAIICPMLVGHTLIGVIAVYSFRRDAYTPYHVDMVRALASYTAVALDNTHAYQKLNTALADLKEAQSQLVHSEKMASLGQLTAGIAHEINNPINFVSANVRPLQRDIAMLLDILARYSSLEPTAEIGARLAELRELRSELEIDYIIEEIDKLIRGIDDGARRTAEIVKGLRNFSRVDESDLKRVDLHEGLDSTLVLLQNSYKDRIEVIRDYADIPDVECYPGQLNQVFMNLLTNAIQSIDGPGTITIRTARDVDSVRVSIRDTGAGIPDEIRERIFDPFFTTKDVGKGTGLGLSITLGIIRKHHGLIEIDSAPGQGTTFTLTLPIDQTQAAPPEALGQEIENRTNAES
jgi:signal transduction histidine kinase